MSSLLVELCGLHALCFLSSLTSLILLAFCIDLRFRGKLERSSPQAHSLFAIAMSSELISHQLVDKSFDSLKFKAAAAYQIPSLHKPDCNHLKTEEADSLLVVSPYTSRAHLLNLDTVSTPNQILAKALTVLQPIRDDYATAPYKESFNWDYVIHTAIELAKAVDYSWRQEPQSFYIVVFRSQVPPTTDRSHLAALDEKSHEEAMETGGLLK